MIVRNYKNYDVSEYICRLRMLNNFEGLTPNEVEENYSRIFELTHHDSDVMHDFKINERATIFYLMANKEYDKVLPILKRHPESMHDPRYRPFYLKYLITAAREKGDNATLMSALQDYNDYLEEQIDNDSKSKAMELQIMYDVESLRRQSLELHSENISIIQARNRNIIILASIVALMLIIFLIMVLRLYYRQKKLSLALTKSEKTANRKTVAYISAARDYNRP